LTDHETEPDVPPDLAERLVEAHRAGRLIETEYPYTPRTRPYADSAAGRRIAALFHKAEPRARRWLRQTARYRADFEAIAMEADPSGRDPAWINGMLPGLDSMVLYAFIRMARPKTYVEVGSGNSTKFVRRAIEDGKLRTRIVSIDPYPRAEIDALCDEVIRSPLEDLADFSVFERLSANDVVFIDNSHRSFQNSDVTVFFTEVLTTIPRGVYVGVHDILLPMDYPPEWRDRFYNEQYLLACYLLGGAARDKVEFPGAYVSDHAGFGVQIAALFDNGSAAGASRWAASFWLRRGARR
jgi:hypothetical protein